ncbi:tetratricopeptide repeat protein [Methanoregula sp.]|uniref:tetratricopeptide repeat protein n=1 Tax=Methanoregula sp. TaxID=2052170 RepID=UPI003BB15509
MQTSAKVGIVILIVILLVPVVAGEDATEWYTKAQNAAMNGDYTDAVTYYNNAIALNPTYDTAYAGEAVALNELGQYSAALTAANQALAIRTSPTALGARADALFYLGQYNDAIGAYTNYTAVVFNQASGYCNLAYSYVQENNTALALTAYSQCTHLNPGNPLVWDQIGLVDMSLGQYTDALNAFSTATSLTTTNAQIWNDKGEALVALGRYQDALYCFNTALSLEPTYAAAQVNKAAAMGKGQVSMSSYVTTPTEAPWYLGGITPTSATPTPVATPLGTVTQTEQTTTILPTTQQTPVPTRTTFTPLSPVPVLAGLGAAAVLLSWNGKGKNH